MIRKIILCMAIAAITLVPLSACSSDEEPSSGVKTIKVGALIDLSGPAANAYRTVLWLTQDWIRHVNEEDPIEGVTLELVSYDTKYDTSRTKPGYDWLREQGAVCIAAITGPDQTALAPYTEGDQFPVFGFAMTSQILANPGWTFASQNLYEYYFYTMLEYISRQWNYSAMGRKPRIGGVGWTVGTGKAGLDGANAYCLAHPDKFEWVAALYANPGTVSWYSEIEQLKSCDYIVHSISGSGSLTFCAQLAEKKYYVPQIHAPGSSYQMGALTDHAGSLVMDRHLICADSPLWTDEYPIVQTYKDLLYANHSEAEADEQYYKYTTYLSTIFGVHLTTEVIRQAVENVGAEAVDGAAVYEAATQAKLEFPGLGVYQYDAATRTARQVCMIYEYSAIGGKFVALTDYIPFVTDV